MSLIKDGSSGGQIRLSYGPMIQTHIGRCSDLYWSTLRAILVRARTNIDSLMDQYRFIPLTSIAWEDSLQESVIHPSRSSRLEVMVVASLKRKPPLRSLILSGGYSMLIVVVNERTIPRPFLRTPSSRP